MTTKHSQTPWELCHNQYDPNLWAILDAYGNVLAHGVYCGQPKGQQAAGLIGADECRANGALLRAAPELLAACAAALRYVEAFPLDRDNMPGAHALAEELRGAIGRATGQ